MTQREIRILIILSICFIFSFWIIDRLQCVCSDLQMQVDELETKLEEVKSDKPDPIIIRFEKGKSYSLTDAERDYIERVVMAEAGAEDLISQVLIAQCILNSCLQDQIRPIDVCISKKYAKPYKNTTESVREAIRLVFDDGYKYTDENIQYFYAPDLCKSDWHESQCFVLEYGGHRFFK